MKKTTTAHIHALRYYNQNDSDIHTSGEVNYYSRWNLCTTNVGSTGWLSFEFLCMYKYSCDKTISIQLSIVVKVSLDAKVKAK